MKTTISEIRESLKSTLEHFLGPLKVRVDKPTNYEVNGTIEAPQGKKMVQGIYSHHTETRHIIAEVPTDKLSQILAELARIPMTRSKTGTRRAFDVDLVCL